MVSSGNDDSSVVVGAYPGSWGECDTKCGGGTRRVVRLAMQPFSCRMCAFVLSVVLCVDAFMRAVCFCGTFSSCVLRVCSLVRLSCGVCVFTFFCVFISLVCGRKRLFVCVCVSLRVRVCCSVRILSDRRYPRNSHLPPLPAILSYRHYRATSFESAVVTYLWQFSDEMRARALPAVAMSNVANEHECA